MNGIYCPLCGGDMEEIIGGDGIQCETCRFIIRSNNSKDFSEVEEYDND